MRKRLFFLANKIKRIEYQIETLRTNLEPNAVRYDLDKVITSPKDIMAETFEKIDELETELKETRAERRRLQERMADLFSELEESPEKTILFGYDLQGMTMEQIATDLNYNVKHCYKLRDKGIRELREK